MTQNRIKIDSKVDPACRILAKAACAFPDGETKILYATELSMHEVSLITLSPPPVYTTFSLARYPRGHAALPLLKARGVATYLDPDNALKSGFRAVFYRPSDEAMEMLGRALLRLKIIRSRDLTRTLFERRRDPRVSTALNALVETSGRGQHNARLLDLSISGAFIAYRSTSLLDKISVGDELSIEILEESKPEHLSVMADVVRIGVKDGLIGAGVHFRELDHATLARLEGVILQILCNLDPKSFEDPAV